MWVCILVFSIILAYSLIINTRYERPFTMELNEFDEKFHTRLEDKSFQCYEYENSLGSKVTYYFEKKFYNEPFTKIQISEFSNDYDLIDYSDKDVNSEFVETFKNIKIPIKIKIDKSIISIKSKFNLNDINYGICLIYLRSEPEDVEIEKAVERMFQTIDEYIVIEE